MENAHFCPPFWAPFLSLFGLFLGDLLGRSWDPKNNPKSGGKNDGFPLVLKGKTKIPSQGAESASKDKKKNARHSQSETKHLLLRLYRVCLICVRALLFIGSLADLLISALFNCWLVWLSTLLLTCLLVHVLICIKRAREAQVQILVKLCTQALQDLTTDVPRKPRCRFWSNCVLKSCRI